LASIIKGISVDVDIHHASPTPGGDILEDIIE
jgi:hypothetical protein